MASVEEGVRVDLCSYRLFQRVLPSGVFYHNIYMAYCNDVTKKIIVLRNRTGLQTCNHFRVRKVHSENSSFVTFTQI